MLRMNHLILPLRTMAASLYYCTHSLAYLMHAGFAHADATIITITPPQMATQPRVDG